ncbi:Non-specific lipid-transfer protein [Actinidia chinensis var. chinensis]|uniref:Non-specific lipid-transfer protein n=1 Tax=Actinidia chinensis var. chinensis TaxID=1590841 RepID=A0A2R6RG20_ACTCC|nr:Non-specific lipid-transfer protein [Actinidia chinensis var. chinensis]
MAAVSYKVACIAVLCMVAVAVAPYAEAAITCGMVQSKLAPCVTYLKSGGAVPPKCCSGVKGLNSLASTKPDRQQACQCIKNAAQQIPGINPGLASGLPGKCGVKIPYPISPSTDCSKYLSPPLSLTHIYTYTYTR